MRSVGGQFAAVRGGERRSVRGIVLVAGASLCWSIAGILIRLVDVGAWEIIFWRSLFFALTIFSLLLLRYRARVFSEFRAAGPSGILAGLLLSLTFILFVFSITRTTVANALVIMSSSPLFAAILARVILGESVHRRTWLVIGSAMAGIILMFVDSLKVGNLIGNLLALGVPISFAGYVIILRRNRDVNMIPAVCLAGALALAVALPLASPFEVTVADILILAVLGVFQIGLGFILFTFGSRHLPAAEIGLLTLLETILGPLWVWIGIGERPTLYALIGGAIVIAALAVHSLLKVGRSKPPVGLA